MSVCATAVAQNAVAAKPDPATVSAAEATPAEPTTTQAVTKRHDEHYVIGSQDVLSINVWKEPEISRSLPVRSDGKISLPLAGEVQAAGRTPLQLERTISGKLKAYMTDPEVTVMVQQSNSEKFNLLGEVVRPGSYPLTRPTTVLDAIAAGGGFRDFAKRKDIYILRRDAAGAETRIRFNYKDVIKGKRFDENIQLQPNDTVVVP
ncbi:MAG: polysaccharide biosynthesis/export family protein [Terracidiphilus sp.]